MITNLYIDGFNLYYRALKDTPFRWLDLRKLAETLFASDSIHRVSYFTARLDVRPGNPGQAQRQLIYLRALATLPGFDAYYGVFRSGVKRRPLVEPTPGLPDYVLVRDSEEKGSDVNLATRLLVDGFNRQYRQAVVVSNDADFAGAMRYVRDDLGLRVTLVNPDPRNSSPRELAEAATYVKRLWKSHLRRSLKPQGPPGQHPRPLAYQPQPGPQLRASHCLLRRARSSPADFLQPHNPPNRRVRTRTHGGVTGKACEGLPMLISEGKSESNCVESQEE